MLLKQKLEFLLGDVFEISPNIDGPGKKFLRMMMELFHMIQERNERFPKSLRDILGQILEPMAWWEDENGNLTKHCPKEAEYLKMVMWVWDKATKRLWHYHILHDVRLVYANADKMGAFEVVVTV